MSQVGLAHAVCTDVVCTVGCEAIGTYVISTVSRYAIYAHMKRAIGSKAVGTDVISTISRYTVGAYMIGTISRNLGGAGGVVLDHAVVGEGRDGEGGAGQYRESQAENQFGRFHEMYSEKVKTCQVRQVFALLRSI